MSAEEDRNLFESSASSVTVGVATGTGVVCVDIVGDRIGSFGITTHCTARDLTRWTEGAAVATPNDVLAGPLDALAETGFGAAAYVGSNEQTLLASTSSGTVGAYDDEWRTLGSCNDINAIADGLIATDAGVYRGDTTLTHVGLSRARDVTEFPVPRAATDEGVYRLGNGWIHEQDGSATVVAGNVDRAWAVIDGTVHRWVDGEWLPDPIPSEETVVDIAVGPDVYAITDAGTMLLKAADAWRSHAIGMPDIGGITVLLD